MYRAIMFAMAAALWLAPGAWAQEHQHDHMAMTGGHEPHGHSAHAAPEAIPVDTELAVAVENHTGGQPCGLGSRYGLCPMRDHSAMQGCCLRSCAHMPFMPDGGTAFPAPEAALGEELAVAMPRLDPIPFSTTAAAFVSRGGQPHFHPPRA
ncbi:MAG: hypothetical protein HY804_02030 [Nitrospinae bacterium]|nr:hypothetical protein [Nitrospinota bacterium]